MNLLSRWSHWKSRALGFLTTEACTPRGIAAHFVVKHRLKRLSEAITDKAGKSMVAEGRGNDKTLKIDDLKLMIDCELMIGTLKD